MIQRVGWIGIGLLALAGCATESVDGKQAYLEDCSACHGANGKGDGPLARDLAKAPADLTTLAARYDGIYPRDYVMSTIDGLHRQEGFSYEMPEFGAGDMGEIVLVGATPIPARLLALANYIGTLQD